MSSCDSVGQLVRLLRLQLLAHHFHGDRKSLGYEMALHRSHSFRHGMVWQGLCKRKSGGAAAPPLNCLTQLNAAFHCKDQAAISEMVEQEQWGAEGAQPSLNCSHYIMYNLNAGCSAGSAPFLWSVWSHPLVPPHICLLQLICTNFCRHTRTCRHASTSSPPPVFKKAGEKNTRPVFLKAREAVTAQGMWPIPAMALGASQKKATSAKCDTLWVKV
jgi:hypothetical protein